MLIQEKINQLTDKTVILQIMGSFVPAADFREIKLIVSSVYDFLKNSSPNEIENKIFLVSDQVDKITQGFIDKVPLKKSIKDIAADFNLLFLSNSEVYTYGIDYGWLEERMDLSFLDYYKDTPYHFKIGLGAHKGNGSIEEDFLLKDAFNILIKAEYYFNLLNTYGEKLKHLEGEGKLAFNQTYYKQLSDIKFEVAAFSRLAIISFYAFLECFVNSIGYNFFYKNQKSLNESDREILQGFKKGRYMQLKSKMEKFPSIIRKDKTSPIIVSDIGQIKEPFKSFFEYYNELRNASVHHSPTKEKIWLKPQDWLEKAQKFSELTLNVALDFWKSCHDVSDGPEYLGKFIYSLHIEKAKND